MALDSRRSDDRHKITDNTKLTRMSASFAEAKHLELEAFPMERGMLYQIQKIQDDIKELHRYLSLEVTSNTSTNLSSTANGTSLTINSSDGNNASIPAATTNAWGAMTDENFDAIVANTAKTTFPGFGTISTRAMRGNTTTISSTQANAIAANTAKFSAPGVYNDGGTERVFIPFTDFKGDAYDAGYTPRGATITNTRGALLAVWPGIDGKRVTHVIVHTSANISRSVTPYRLTPGTFTALANAGNSNTNLQPTRWTCAVGESYGILIAPGATNVFIQGATLTLG